MGSLFFALKAFELRELWKVRWAVFWHGESFKGWQRRVEEQNADDGGWC
jgi:hypothetical protein